MFLFYCIANKQVCKNACHAVEWFCQSKPVCKADRYLESLLAGKVPGMPDRKRMLPDQVFHIRRLFPGMQPQEMAAGLECNGKVNLMDMLALLLHKCLFLHETALNLLQRNPQHVRNTGAPKVHNSFTTYV